MNLQERDQLNVFLRQLTQVQASQKDAEAETLIREACARQPDSGYLLVQRAMQLEYAMQAMKDRCAQLQAELDAVRGAWLGVLKTMAPAPQAPEKREHREEFVFADDELLQRFGFTMRFTNMAERGWFTQRVRDWEKVLNEKFATVLARNALMTELRIFQLDSFLNDPETCKTGESNSTNSLKPRQTLDENYQGQISQIKEL
jgi:hypothetical protein